MAIKEVRFEHFRGRSGQYAFGQKNKIGGKNETGKSSIKEMICFAFCGTDSTGRRNPQHVISEGETDCKVTVSTDKAEISRTLTRKGNGSIKIIRGGMPTTVNQSEMSQMIGSIDLFLSAFVPGYFLDLPATRQHTVVTEVMPTVDRDGLFFELAGFHLSKEEKIRYALHKRSDLVANTVAGDRREIEREVDIKAGEKRQLESIKPLTEPIKPGEVEICGRYRFLKRGWEDYDRDARQFQNYKMRYDQAVRDNTDRADRSKTIEDRLRSLVVPQSDGVRPDLESMMGGLRDKVQQLPVRPALMNVVESDHCSTCGQPVGLKHRDRVKEENNRVVAQWEESCQMVQESNSRIEGEINGVQKEYKASLDRFETAERGRSKIEADRRQLEIQLAGLQQQSLPVEVNEPVAPEEAYNEEGHLKAQSVADGYQRTLAEYEVYRRNAENAQAKIKDLTEDITDLMGHAERLKSIEATIKRIPQEELRRQAGIFEMEGLEFHIGEEIEIVRHGIPYKLLSTGATMKVGVQMSSKLNQLMKKPINMVFIDNVDLLDELPKGYYEALQVFVARVEPEKTEITIEHF